MFNLKLVLLLTLIIYPITGNQFLEIAVAQSSPPKPIGTSEPIKIDGSTSIKTINQKLKKLFEKKYPNSTVQIAESGTDQALKLLLEGTIDLAAIGRPLTTAEKAQGLVTAPISRQKIAIIVGTENPFKGNITLNQLAEIFKGKIKNWSEVGGPDVPIRVIERPETSDTRQALSSYPVFKNTPLGETNNFELLLQDNTDEVITRLGKDGISYALIEEVRERPNIKIIPLDNLLPEEHLYPLNQPLAYAYKSTNVNERVKAFLCANTSEPKDRIVFPPEFCTEKVATQQITPVEPSSRPEWLLLFLTPLLFIPLYLGRKKPQPVIVKPVRKAYNRLILTPRNCRDAYAYWEITNERKQELRDQGGVKLAIRLYHLTNGVRSLSFETFEIKGNEQDLHLLIRVDNRVYQAELGYLTSQERWLMIAQSPPVTVPACPPSNDILKDLNLPIMEHSKNDQLT